MTATYNDAEAERLVREARQSLDGAFTFARPWAVREHIGAMADQLEAARDIIDGLSPQAIQALVDENDRLRKALDELLTKLQSKASVHSGFCCWCGQHWPHLDGESYETFRKYTIEHAETCPAHNIRIERDAARAEVERMHAECNDAADRDAELYRARARIAELEASVTDARRESSALRDRRGLPSDG